MLAIVTAVCIFKSVMVRFLMICGGGKSRFSSVVNRWSLCWTAVAMISIPEKTRKIIVR